MSQKDSDTSVHTNFTYVIKNPESYTDNLIKGDNAFILTEEEKAIGTDIIREFRKNLDNFNNFLNLEYMDFDHKINKCMMKNCYSDILK
jgi:hypothetical protein